MHPGCYRSRAPSINSKLSGIFVLTSPRNVTVSPFLSLPFFFGLTYCERTTQNAVHPDFYFRFFNGNKWNSFCGFVGSADDARHQTKSFVLFRISREFVAFEIVENCQCLTCCFFHFFCTAEMLRVKGGEIEFLLRPIYEWSISCRRRCSFRQRPILRRRISR